MPSWKKVITSGSNASLNSLNVINGLTVTGSLNHLGDYNHTGSVYHTGSKFLTGIFSQTGSLNISGSTTQIGTNTLLGNTTLSGSIIISGSTTVPVTPTIKIYGDMETDGVIKFMPVSKNIDTSISASYIYVSGSTQDLFFSQNGSGYNNVSRLRWLEGNLYTGLLHGGLITTQSSTIYQISSGSGIIVNLNATIGDDPYPTIQFLEWGNLSASIAPLTASYQQAFVGIDSTNNIYAQGIPFNNGQFNDIINIGNVLFQNQSTINGVKTQPSVAYGFEQSQNIFNRAFGPLKLSGYTLTPSGSSTGSLIVGSGTAYAPGANYTLDPTEPSYTVDAGTDVSKIFRYYQSGSSWVYLTNGGAGYATIDATQYSNNGTLTSVGGGNWSIQRVFYFPNSVTKAIVVYFGNAVYPTEADALANLAFESFVEAPNTAANAIYLGAIIINQNGVFTSPNTFTIYPGGLFRQVGGSGGGGSTVTTTLSGLSDVNITTPTNYQALVYDNTQLKWINSSAISASITGNASTATSASYAATASYVVTAQTASYVLNAVSASFSTTASYAIQALSASYAPAGNPFPYTGSAEITGSLGITGSLSLQTYNGITNVTALDFGGVTRVINDVMGSTSINADDRDLYDSSAINSVNWEVRRLIDSSGVVAMRWDQRSTYDTVDSQSIDWSSRLLKIDNGPASYTVNWNTGILRDTNAKNSIDWQNRIAIDTANKDSINWQNRQLKDSTGTEILNWTSGVSITGSATVSGSLTVTGSLLITGSSTLINQGPTILSGSFKVQGEGTGFTGPFRAIEVDDANFSRNLYDLNAGSSSIDFGNRSLNSATGQPVISWDGQAGIYNIDLYGSQRISTTNRDSLYGFNSKAGQLLGDSYFDATVSSNELVYLNTDGQWYQVDQTTNTSTKMLGIAIDIFSQTGSVLIEGDIVVSSGGGYPNVNGPNYGLPIYIREGGGTLMSTTIPTTGYVRLLGYCYTSYNGGVDWIMKFRPSNEWYVI